MLKARNARKKTGFQNSTFVYFIFLKSFWLTLYTLCKKKLKIIVDHLVKILKPFGFKHSKRMN